MRVVMTTVGSKGPAEDETQNCNRINAGNEAMDIAKSSGADILILPAGFLFHNNSKSRHEIAGAIIDKARKLKLAVVFGIDGMDDSDRIQAYGYAWSPTENITYCWKQRSSNSQDQWDISQQLCDEVRLLRLKCGDVGVLLCGELFNKRIRDALINEKPNCEKMDKETARQKAYKLKAEALAIKL
jgi:hypothetical protein